MTMQRLWTQQVALTTLCGLVIAWAAWHSESRSVALYAVLGAAWAVCEVRAVRRAMRTTA